MESQQSLNKEKVCFLTSLNQSVYSLFHCCQSHCMCGPQREWSLFNLSIYVQTARCKQQIQLFTSAAPCVKGNQRLNTPTAHSYWWCMLMFSPPSSLCQNQHDELKRQYYDLQEQHQVQGKDHGRLLDEHRERYSKLQQAKEVEISQLNGTYGYESSSLFCFYFYAAEFNMDSLVSVSISLVLPSSN